MSLANFCRYLNQCGGCQVELADRLAAWRELIQASDWHPRQRTEDRKIEWIAAEEFRTEFRGRVQLRGRMDRGRRIRLGYFARGSRFFVGIDDCTAAHPSIRHLIRACSDQQAESTGVRGFRLQVMALGQDQLYVSLLGGHELEGADLDHLSSRLGAIDGLSIYFARSETEARQLLQWDQEDGIRFYVGGLSFCQSNRSINREMRRYILESVRRLGPDQLIDAYAGNGNLSLLLAAHGIRVMAVENFPVSVEALKRSRDDLHYPENMQVIASDLDLESLRPQISPQTLILVDPPRAGMGSQARILAELPNTNLIYISCSREAFIKDWHELRKSYAIVSACGFDMFPRQAEVEMVLSMKSRTSP